MKVISWNIAGGYTHNGEIKHGASVYKESNLDYFINSLQKTGADFIGLQEAHTYVNASKINQAQTIAEKLKFISWDNYACKLNESHIEPGAYLSMGNLYKSKVNKNYIHLFTNPNLKLTRPNKTLWVSLDAGFLVTEVAYEGQLINLANCYLMPLHYFGKDYSDPEFGGIRKEMEKFIIDLSARPTIALGDYNYANLISIFPNIFKIYKDAFEKTDTTPNKGQQDHILFSKHWNLKNYKIKKLQADHLLCEAELSLKKS